MKYHSFLRKRTNTHPGDGPFHHRSPAKILWRVVRGMVPHKTERGQEAMTRLKVYEGIPAPFDKLARQVVPSALRQTRLRPGRRYCRLGDLSTHVGWQHNKLIQQLESKRKIRSKAYYIIKKSNTKLINKAKTNVANTMKSQIQELQKLGY